MYEQITDVGRELGLDINPHLYRHLLQKVCVERDPSSVGDVSRVLGHATVSTTMTFYAERSGRAASKRLDALLAAGRMTDQEGEE
jgi:integrase